MPRKLENKYDLTKQGKTTQYRNQGYSGEDLYNIDQRKTSYEKWNKNGNAIPKWQEDRGPHDQIGRVSSSWLDTLGYDSITGEAIATFKNSPGEFRYIMNWHTFLAWLNSPSKGRWLNNYAGKSNYTETGSRGKTFEGRLGGRKARRPDPVRQSKSRRDRYLAKYR